MAGSSLAEVTYDDEPSAAELAIKLDCSSISILLPQVSQSVVLCQHDTPACRLLSA